MKKYIFLFVSIIFLQCTHDDTIRIEPVPTDSLTSSLLENNNTARDGLQSSDTPIPGTWFIQSHFLASYQHFCQLTASPQYPGATLCGPTSYMLGAHMLATHRGYIYPAVKTQVGVIYTRLVQAGKFDNQEGMYINDIDWYAGQYDETFLTSAYKRTSSRVWMKEFIEYQVKTGYPVIAAVQIYGNKRSSWALNDSNLFDQPGKTYYISKNGTVGHFILIIGIKINPDGSGTVWYKDPLAPTSATQSASYTRVLDAMKYNGNDTYYDAIGLF